MPVSGEGIAIPKLDELFKKEVNQNDRHYIWLEIFHFKSIFTVKTGCQSMKRKLRMVATICGMKSLILSQFLPLKWGAIQ